MKARSRTVWALISPKNKIIVETLAPTRDECWTHAFDIVSLCLGDHWRKQFWKCWPESIASARTNCWRMEKMTVHIKDVSRCAL